MTTTSLPQTATRKVQPLTVSVISVTPREPRLTAGRRVTSRFLQVLLRSLSAVHC